jgi:Tfp pilus assembly pilus retraction ATPase PilT
VDLHSVLLRAIQGGASDVHLKIGQPPVLRREGSLAPLEGWPPLDQQQLESVLATVTAHDPARRASFEATGDLDLAYKPTDLPRFRVNGFRQRGAISFAFRAIPERVHRGVSIAQPLIEHSVFPPMVSQMVKIGEETGELDAMLGKIADFYEEEVDAAIGALMSIIEPIMMIGVGSWSAS